MHSDHSIYIHFQAVSDAGEQASLLTLGVTKKLEPEGHNLILGIDMRYALCYL